MTIICHGSDVADLVITAMKLTIIVVQQTHACATETWHEPETKSLSFSEENITKV